MPTIDHRKESDAAPNALPRLRSGALANVEKLRGNLDAAEYTCQLAPVRQVSLN